MSSAWKGEAWKGRMQNGGQWQRSHGHLSGLHLIVLVRPPVPLPPYPAGLSPEKALRATLFDPDHREPHPFHPGLQSMCWSP